MGFLRDWPVVGFAVGNQRRDVVSAVFPPVGELLTEVTERFAGSCDVPLDVVDAFDHVVDPSPESVTVLRRQPEQSGGDEDGYVLCIVSTGVSLPRAGESVDQRVARRFRLRDQPLHSARRERRKHHSPVPGVIRWVDANRRHFQQPFGSLVVQVWLPRREARRVVGNPVHVLVLHRQPGPLEPVRVSERTPVPKVFQILGACS